MKTRTQVKAGGSNLNHNETLNVRTALKSGGTALQHNETLHVRTALKAGGVEAQHNETFRTPRVKTIDMRRHPRTTSAKDDRLELLVVRAGLRAGARRGRRGRR